MSLPMIGVKCIIGCGAVHTVHHPRDHLLVHVRFSSHVGLGELPIALHKLFHKAISNILRYFRIPQNYTSTLSRLFPAIQYKQH